MNLWKMVIKDFSLEVKISRGEMNGLTNKVINDRNRMNESE